MTKKSFERVREYWKTEWPNGRLPETLAEGPLLRDKSRGMDNCQRMYKKWPDETGFQDVPIGKPGKGKTDLARLLIDNLLAINNLPIGRVDLLPTNKNGDVPYVDVVDHALDIHALIYGETLTPDQEEALHEVIDQAVILIDTKRQKIHTAARIDEARQADRFND